jgi:hypothetical protein
LEQRVITQQNRKKFWYYRLRYLILDEKILDYKANLYLDCRAGINRYGIKNNSDMYRLMIYRTEDVIRLANMLLPLSRHQEKINKMSLVVNNKNTSWKQIKDKVLKIRNKIKKERLN